MLTATLFTLVFGALLALAMVGAVYAIPIRRTWRKEHGERLATPGPELEAYEASRSRELTRAGSAR